MALKKCPLCDSRLLNGVCNGCGYSVPDETEISSMYNYDPDDDNFGEEDKYAAPAGKYAQPDPDGKRDEVIKPGQEVHIPKRAPEIKKAENNAVQVNANPYANFSPVNNQQKTPVQNRQGNSNVPSAADPVFIRDVVIGVVLALVFSFFGVLYGMRLVSKFNRTKDTRYLYAGIIIFVLSGFGLIF